MMRGLRPYTYLGTVRGMCRKCRSIVNARLLEEGGAVYQERICPSCGTSRAVIAESLGWYTARARETVQTKTMAGDRQEIKEGCPHDCGPCSFHANACHLPVFSVTNTCNLQCPICFTYNLPQPEYFMSREEVRGILKAVVDRSGPLDLVNITGGEPTLHPEILSLLEECKGHDVGRITLNSNGLRLSRDAAFCEELARMGVYVILSINTLDPETSKRIHGRDIVSAKLGALDNLQRAGVGTTLLNVLIRGTNDGELGKIVDLAKSHSNVRSLTVQTMTFTGQGGGRFTPRRHMTLDAAEGLFEEATGGEFRADHFIPHPGAHPLCYSVAYYLKDGGAYHSFTDLLGREGLREILGGGYLLQLDDSSAGLFQDALTRIWAEEGEESPLIGRIKGLLKRLYPPGHPLSRFERQRAGEEEVLTVYIHSHMDEDTLDLSRLVVCPDQVPDSQGRMIPACAYNLFYRMKDPRFWLSEPNGRPAVEEAIPGDSVP